MSIQHFFYAEQLRNYLLQFCNIFTGLQVATGKGADGQASLLPVPVVIGNRDRVVAAINAGNTQNKTFALPAMAAYMSGIELNPSRRKGVNVVDSRVMLPEGGVFPDDLKVIKRVMPIPYDLQLELGIYASNTQQLHQILEQILVLFDPILQVQTTDAAFDWTKITTVELMSVNNEENYPVSADRRTIMWTLNFQMPIWLSIPLDVKNEIVKKIFIEIGDMDGMDVSEVNENGDMQPFKTLYGISIVERST